jgi:hypothetical protein
MEEFSLLQLLLSELHHMLWLAAFQTYGWAFYRPDQHCLPALLRSNILQHEYCMFSKRFLKSSSAFQQTLTLYLHFR